MRHALPLLLLLAACAETGTGPGQPDTSGADTLSAWLGQPASALPPREGPVRIIAPGSAVTMDYRADRLNADLDAAGRITRLWCG